MLALDRALYDLDVGLRWWLHGAGEPGGAGALMSTIAGSMITVAGVAFSIVVVALALLLALAGVAMLIYFIHHAAASIQASEVVAVAGEELDEAIRQTFVAGPAPAGTARTGVGSRRNPLRDTTSGHMPAPSSFGGHTRLPTEHP